MAFCVIPALYLGFNATPSIHWLEIAGFAVTISAYLWESTADYQKDAFLRKAKKANLKNQVCNVGLWSVVRHPNYFGEWNVWNGLIIASIPAMCPHMTSGTIVESDFVATVLIWSCMSLSYTMYDFLVN